MKPALSITIAFAFCCVIGSLATADEPPSPGEIRFNEHIRPIFIKHCTACHGGVMQAGDLSFVYRDQVLPPDGWIVEPGDPESSVIIERVISEDPEERMPPPEHGPALSNREIELLRQWITQGAPWQEHWAYVPPEPQAIPSVRNQSWPRQPADNFVLARLEREGIEPARDAEAYRWLRRVTLDLTGLPPTLDERTSFLADFERNAEAAYERAVDRMLKSPAFGERWASVWLDQVRYADSKGLGLDARRSVWKYRDWVIDALNQDLPYDQFTVKQIAGDLLPESTIEDLIATAAHRVTQSNEEGGTDDEEFRVAAVLDRVNTTWQAWQGVTFGCTQCHDHPYDPFQHDEYYKFAAFFNNTTDCDLDQDWPVAQAPLDTQQYGIASDLDRRIRELNEAIWKEESSLLAEAEVWKPLVAMEAISNNATQLEVERQGDHDEFHTVDTVSRDTDITLEAPLPENLQRLTAIRLTGMPLDPQSAVPDSEWGFVLSHIEAHLLVPDQEEPLPISLARVVIDEPDPFYDPQESLNEKSNHGFSTFSRIHYPRQAAFILDSPLEIPKASRLRVKLKHRVFILSAFALITRRGHLAVSDDARFSELFTREDLAENRKQLADLRTQRGDIESVSVPVLVERLEHLTRPQHVFERGLFLTKGDRVTAATPASLPPLPDELPPNRLALAKWMASTDNPLTARVAVNRVWARLFGVGLVETEEDFGSSGEPPSHPQLLDFLAMRFQHDLQWSMKQLIRELVLSRTYRQSAKIRPDLLERDPRNRLLARGPRNRLSAEIVRDQALAVAGLLSRKQFGPPVHPPIPEGVWKPFQAGDKWNTPNADDADRYRRSIYTYTKRSIPYPMFAAFDAPSREFCAPRRLPSNTPLQALMTLNDATFKECADALAERMRGAAETPSQQIRHGFLIVTCREATDPELDKLMALHDLHGDKEDAMNTIARVLLNLDEVLMK